MQTVNHVTCEKRSYTREFTSHQHDFGQFLFPLKGSLDIQTKWQEINLNSDYCFYIPPKLEHNYRSMDRNEFLILDIPSQYLPEDTSDMYIRLDKQWTSIRYLLLEEAKSQENLSSLVNLTRYVTNKLQISKPPSIEFIHKHYKEPIKLETLANYVNTTTVSMSILGEPIGATILAIILLGEPVIGLKLVGGFIVLLGVFLFLTQQRKLAVKDKSITN
nr:hypothetical protein [Neobacillus sp. Marseille-Q6967]